MQASAQPYQAAGNPEKYPIANQFEHLSVDDGLSNNYVTAILQDRDGYMWFGTGDGLNKYDGASFTVFKPNPSQPARSFQNGYIMGLCEGDSNQIWAITNGGGLHEINRKTGLVTPHLIQAAQANRWNTQHSIFLDQQQLLWISTRAGLVRYEPGRHHFTLYPPPIADVPIITAFEDRQQRFWVATQRGLFLFNRSTGRYTPVTVPGLKDTQPAFQSFYLDQQDVLWLGSSTEGYSLFKIDLHRQPLTPIPYNPGGKLNPYIWRNTVHQDSTGLIWMGTTNGLQALNPVTHQVFTYQSDPNRYKGLASSSAQTVFHDRSGMIWIGTDNGIDRQAVNTRPFVTYQVKPNERRASMPENRVYAVFKDKQGRLWFNNAPTLFRLSADGKQLDRIAPENRSIEGLQPGEVTAFLPDGKDGIWLGSYGGLVHYDPATDQYKTYPSKIPARYLAVQSMNRTPKGDIWIGGENGFASFNPLTHQYTYYPYQPGNPNSIPDKDVYGLLVSQTGEVWILIHRMGVCRLNLQTGRMIHYTTGPRGNLSSNDVRTIYEDEGGTIWIGTHRGGLNRFDQKMGQFTAVTHPDGIPGNTIVGITGDKSGNLWLSTNEGLCRFNPQTRDIQTYQVSDGLPSNNFKQSAVFRHTDELFFGSENGVVHFNPEQIRDNNRPFPVYITDLKVMEKPRALTNSVIRLQHDETFFSIGFAALDYEQPDKNQYAYRLEGLNQDWVQNGNRHVANFTTLPSGTYTFRVKAANGNGFWSTQQASVQLIVLPPWWATWWAYSLYALLAGAAIWGYIRFSTNRIQQRQELEFNRRQAEQFKTIDELKTRFFSNITHEFRTPLSLIIAPVDKLLQDGRFDGPALTTVRQNAERLLRLINQLLDLSKLEGHHMSVSRVQGRVIDFIEQIVGIFQRAAEQKGILFTCRMEHFPTHEYVFDADKWEKIVTNLLANALKFTGAGGSITLTITPIRAETEMTGVEFELTDTGIGIAPEQLPHIFDRFYQADSSSTRAHEGTGLGLALVNELIQLLGGKIAVESQVKEGATFRWTLPVEPVPATASYPAMNRFANLPVVDPVVLPVSTAVVKPVGEQPRSRVLVVEDNEELRAFLVGELAPSYDVLQAVDGQEGWEVVQAELPDVVLTDVMMPRLDGHALCQLIKNHPDTDHIAVIMLTAKAAQSSRIEGFQHGADEYLSKPFSMAELQLRLQNLLTRQQKLGDVYRQRFALPEEPKVLPAELPTPLPEITSDPFLMRIYAILDQHLDNPLIGVEWLADKLGMNRKTLYRKIQSLIQLAPAELIRQYRIRKAAEFLLAGSSVAETADRVGFNTPSHFSMVFKDIYHQTPTEFITKGEKDA
ncbi:hybrid sensor histidine kinase/response regulator transcription factor [Larkinella terrae]|uniref:histidine kinase n=1 Tax=Larkinella terrae TaxID=2025311 RepID=A0A7K0EF71_9BACT|nr:two-component regulator propeller domain-containing protein [Larkinella terrae]MRS60395.1 response regulator [Larkinella terrae]